MFLGDYRLPSNGKIYDVRLMAVYINQYLYISVVCLYTGVTALCIATCEVQCRKERSARRWRQHVPPNVAARLRGVTIQKIAYSTNLNVNLMNCVFNFYVHIFRLGLRYIFFEMTSNVFVFHEECVSLYYLLPLYTQKLWAQQLSRYND